MQPKKDDLEELASALFTVTRGLERAHRRIPDASTLSVLQILGWAERTDPPTPVRPSEIAQALDVHRSAVTHQVQALERAGHVSLAADPADRRSCFITLTDSGRQEWQRLSRAGLDRFALFVEDWDAEEVRTLTRLLHKFEESKAAAARREPPPSGRHWQQTT